MLPARSFCCCALALGLILLIEPSARADYACDALSLQIATVANNPFSADEVISSWQIAPDGSKKQTGPSLVAHVARDDAGRVLVKLPASFPSEEAREKNEPSFWNTTICDPTGTKTRISQDVHFGETVDPSTGKHVMTVLRVDGKAYVGRGLRHISSYEFDQFRVPPSDKFEDLGYKDWAGIRGHGYRWWRASDGVIDEATFIDHWLSADLASGLSRIDTTSTTESRTELIHLRREEPDLTLFQVPADYKVVYAGGEPPVPPQ
jgi:hypothetical protein